MKGKLAKFLNGLKALILPLACYIIFFALSGGKFGTKATLLNNAVKSVSPILLAYGVQLLVVEGNMDMSVGAQVYLTSIIGANLAKQLGWGIAGIILFCILSSVLVCLVKALVNYFLDVSYNLLSIGYLMITECMTYFLFNAKGATVIGKTTKIAQAPYCLIIVAVAIVVSYFIWNRTVLASHFKAISSNPSRAVMAGIDVKKDEFKAIMLGSIFSGLSSVFFLTNSGQIQPVLNMSSMSLCFDAMVAVFIGQSLQRYVSLPIGIVIGVFTIKMLGTGILSLGIPSYVQNIVTGLFLLIFMAISLNQNKIFEFQMEKKRSREIIKKYNLA